MYIFICIYTHIQYEAPLACGTFKKPACVIVCAPVDFLRYDVIQSSQKCAMRVYVCVCACGGSCVGWLP